MPSQGYTPAENVVILYFASMGFSDNALILLLKHKCQGSGTRLVTYMHSKRSYMKTKPGVWNAMTTRWDLYEVGRYLSGIMSDPVEFRKMIAVGPEEESIYLAEVKFRLLPVWNKRADSLDSYIYQTITQLCLTDCDSEMAS